MFSHNDGYEQNTFIRNGAGVAVMYSRNVTMRHNTFEANRGGAAYGILLKDIQSSYMADNQFKDNTVAIFMEGCTRSTLERNVFRQNGWAIRVQASCDNNIDRDQTGDVPYRPVSLFAMVSDQMPYAMMFWRSFTVFLLDRAEKVIPSLSPDKLRDNSPLMKPYSPE
jgi:nitrous oxidase accessory protein